MRDRDFAGKVTFAASEYGKEREYWEEKFSGELKQSRFPYDRAGSPPGISKKGSLGFEFSGNAFSKLVELSKGLDHRIYMFLAAGLVVLLHKYTGHEDIVIGSPITRQETEGDFINTVLALRNRWDGDIVFKDLLLDRVRQTILEAYDNQNYPFETLLFNLNLSLSDGECPLFDVVVLLRNIHDEKYIRHIRPNVVFSFLRGGDGIEGVVEYNALRYGEATVARMVDNYKRLMDAVFADINIPVSAIDILSGEEKNQLLYDLNDAGRETGYPADKTIHALFEEQVGRTPHGIAVTGTVPGQRRAALTYGKLDQRSNRLAQLLRAKGTEPDSIVGIMAGRSIETVAGILAILKAGGAYLPIEPDYPPERIDFMLTDSGADVLVTDRDPAAKTGFRGEILYLEDNNEKNNENGVPRAPCPVSPSNLAYVIYTSGTTARPKGSLIEHRNVVRLMVYDNYLFDFDGDDTWTMFHSYCFDFSVWEMYGALLNGGKLVIVPKMSAMDPQRFLDILKEEKVSILNQTPAAFYNLADRELEGPDRALNLKYVIFGGEALKPSKLKQWKEKYPGTKLVNMFGITETTVHVTYKELDDEDIRSDISNIGRAIPTLSTYVFDKNLRLVPLGVAGELCVGGDGVCRGYLNQPGLTGEKFVENPYIPGQRLYRSGDLGKITARGDLEYLGRIDHQVKIRGYRIELGEIEGLLSRHPDVGEAVVLCRRDAAGASAGPGDKYLCAYIVPGPPEDVRAYLSRSLPDFMIPSHFVALEKIPLTPNGKVDRKALPAPEAGGIATYAAPQNPVEEKFVEIWSEVLGIAKEKIGIDSDFFELGGHSLKATILMSRLHKTFNVKIPLAELFKTPTIRELAEYAGGGAPLAERFFAIQPVEKKEYYPLSSAQKRLFILQQMDVNGIFYNIPLPIELGEKPDAGKLEDTFCRLIRRHESLRTSFHMHKNEPVQRVHDNVEFQIETLPGADSALPETTMERFVRPFRLERAPLLRAGLIEVSGAKYILMVDMHHIIADGVSMDVLVKDFTALESGQGPPPLRLQYKDYAGWEKRALQSENLKKQEAYWLNIFKSKEMIPVLNLPTDFPRPSSLDFGGGRIAFEIHGELTRNIKSFAAETGTTLYMLLLAVYNVFLARYTGRNDIVVGSPIAGRTHDDLKNIIGMFVNMVAMRNSPKGTKTFREFLNHVKENALDAFENQDYQFDALIERLKPETAPGRHPLVETVFVLQNIMEHGDTPPAQTGEPGPGAPSHGLEHKTAKFDLKLSAIEMPGGIKFNFEYRDRLFRAETIERMTRHFKNLLENCLRAPDLNIAEIDVLSGEEVGELMKKTAGKNGTPGERRPEDEKIEGDFDL